MPVIPILSHIVLTLNEKWGKCGKARLMTWDEYVKKEMDSLNESYTEFLNARCIPLQPAPNAIVVDYDFATDELNEKDEAEFSEDVDLLWHALAQQPNKMYDSDGSGGGLYYGMNIYAG